MKVALFYHSLMSDWNHGNAHFLRGIARVLLALGHQVEIYEPTDAWSVQQLVLDQGEGAIAAFHEAYPELQSHRYQRLDLEAALDGVEMAIVHEWNPPELVARIGEHRRTAPAYRLYFHDTHHRLVTEPAAMSRYDLTHYDGVLAYGAVLRDLYLARNLTQYAWTWHEAADASLFKPHPELGKTHDLIWIGNWGDDERTAELQEFLLDPVAELGLRAEIYGVRYPAAGRAALDQAGIAYRGWVANFRVPETFARARVTVHVPRRPYVRQLPGIPTIRPFEALACGIPLISAPWRDVEDLFSAGEDFLLAENGREMRTHLRAVLHDPALARALAEHGRATILARHTCAHRVQELLEIDRQMRGASV